MPKYLSAQRNPALDETVEMVSTTEPSHSVDELSIFLEHGFAAGFSILDGATGEVIHDDSHEIAFPYGAWAEVCREVSRRGRPEFIEDEDPLLLLAVPFHRPGDLPLVAVGKFITRVPKSQADVAAAARVLGAQPRDVLEWCHRQSCWTPHCLLRMGELIAEKWVSDRRTDRLEREVRGLSLNLATTYEEISLLYRLTQNLKLSSKDEDLGRMALEWLADVVPAQGLAVQLIPVGDRNAVTHEARSEPVFLSHGESLLTAAEFSSLIERWRMELGQYPLILNSASTCEETWPFPSVRELVIVPLSEGNNVFGWLAAFNHIERGEFGTVEASLLSSVAAILGIHSGNTELYRQQSELLAGVVRALTSAIDAKDPYTCGHSDRVARISVRLAEELGCDPEQLNTIYLGGLLHDIGKIGIDDNVLRKPGKLTTLEYEHIKTHAEIGYRILKDLKQLDQILPVVLHHHEQWNGGGYPHGLAGSDIPLLARIVAVADSFDAMGSDRPYRKGMPQEKLDSVLRDGAGTQWDASVVDAFFRAHEDIREIWRRERSTMNVDIHQWI